MDNTRGILLMVAAMAGFAIEDMFIKSVAEVMPIGQIIIALGAGGALAFAIVAIRKGDPLVSRDLLCTPVILRNLAEIVGTIGFVTAIALTPLSSASAIIQATPLVVTLGAALFLGAEVGWRRWSAIIVGLIGVLIIIRPGLSGFEPASLFAVQAVIGLAIRDLATRAVPPGISSVKLSAYGFAMLIPTGTVLLLVMEQSMVTPTPGVTAALCAGILVGVFAYYAITAAMRVGEIAVVTPFRYTRLIFALIIGVTVFNERPDAWTLIGAAIIIASGLYTLTREHRLQRRSRQVSP
ncbi:DMT family transporter [Aliiroseovarius sp. YM-037]|uniref:DMT family transporter n=1 Tax=Aliiroseovarius sp. YM-037 TaxID=3341728 RepID=UPI003A80DA31